jgi:hypothetical protein
MKNPAKFDQRNDIKGEFPGGHAKLNEFSGSLKFHIHNQGIYRGKSRKPLPKPLLREINFTPILPFTVPVSPSDTDILIFFAVRQSVF